MEWTQEKPTKSGYYWVTGGWQVLLVRLHSYDGLHDDRGVPVEGSELYEGAWWQGPLDQPQPPQQAEAEKGE